MRITDLGVLSVNRLRLIHDMALAVGDQRMALAIGAEIKRRNRRFGR